MTRRVDILGTWQHALRTGLNVLSIPTGFVVLAVQPVVWLTGSMRYVDSLAVVAGVSILLAIAAGVYFGRWWGVVPLGVCTISTVGVIVWVAAGPSPYELRHDGETLIAAIEEFRARTGNYPKTLAEAGLAPAPTRYGDWKYRAADDGTRFSLAIGDYGLDGFVLTRDNDGPDWFLDT